jgi:hypothetical protein
VFTGDENTPAGRLKLRRPKYRPLKERDVVVRALARWRERALNQHPHQAVITRRWILPDNAITMLSKLRDTDVHGPETISEVVNGTEEWTLAYAADIYKVITKLDEGKRVRKLCARLSSGAVKKVRSAAWQNRIQKRYEKDAELALITADNASEEIAKLKKAWRKEKATLSTRHKTTAGNMEEIKRTTYIHWSKLCRALENAVRDLERHCELLREFVVWSNSLAEADNTDEEGEGPGHSSKTPVYLPPPVRRSSRQSI